MNPLLRLGKFNLVGAMGSAVQLGALALFNRWLRGHYLVASAAALELTLLHNFVWHVNYTWRDRYKRGPWLQALARFHLSSGLVSMVGNLVLMRLLVHQTRLPLLVANLVAILCCSAVNFSLGNAWAFAERQGKAASSPAEAPRAITLGSLALLLSLLCGAMAHAQTHGDALQQRAGFGFPFQGDKPTPCSS